MIGGVRQREKNNFMVYLLFNLFGSDSPPLKFIEFFIGVIFYGESSKRINCNLDYWLCASWYLENGFPELSSIGAMLWL